MGPETETTPTEPQDVTQLRTQTISPFIEGLFQQPTSPQGNPFAQFLGQSPEQQVLGSQFDALTGLSQGGGLGAAQQVIGAAQPVFQQNLQEAGSQFMAQTPSTFNTAAGAGLGNLQQQALQDFNLFQGQALQQGQQTGLQAAQALGGLGQAAGQAQQRFINPTLQLMLGGMGLAQPMPADVAAQPGLFSQILQAGGTAAGLAASSARFKENITPLDKIRNLNLYDYNYIGSDRRRVGAIVEDETTPDEWVVGGTHIDLYEMMSTLAGAVVELAEKVEELE